MKNNRGIVGIAVLWILAALSALAMTALAIGRWQRTRGRYVLDEQRAIYLALAAVAAARDTDFALTDAAPKFSTGDVRLEKMPATVDETILRCTAHVGTLDKIIETGWRRVGGHYRAVYWREIQ